MSPVRLSGDGEGPLEVAAPPDRGDTMGIYRKKPVVIEARMFTISSQEDVAAWCGSYVRHPSASWQEIVLPIQTLEGEMIARLGDYIIRGIKGEFYPCKPDIFEATYERMVEEPCAVKDVQV